MSCFTETPLGQIKQLLSVERRKINLESYGFVFRRDFLYEKSAQPAHYINNYQGSEQKEAYDKVWEISVNGKFKGKSWRILPFVNVMQPGHDFAWEREWRVLGPVQFDLDDLVCVILPPLELELRRRMAEKGIAAISPGWRYEQMIEELANQQRRTKQIWKDKVPKPKPKLKVVKAG